MKICFASHNSNKIQELNQMLVGVHEIVGLEELGITEEIAETGETFEENSRIKAKYVYNARQIPVFADDSGLCVEALDGDPGVFSARYSGLDKNDQKNIDLLLFNLEGEKNRNAYFATVITYISANGEGKQFYGQVDGQILTEQKGDKGFGYDPIFQPDGYDVSFAQMPSEEKNKISHRAQAVKKLIEYLSSNV